MQCWVKMSNLKLSANTTAESRPVSLKKNFELDFFLLVHIAPVFCSHSGNTFLYNATVPATLLSLTCAHTPPPSFPTIVLHVAIGNCPVWFPAIKMSSRSTKKSRMPWGRRCSERSCFYQLDSLIQGDWEQEVSVRDLFFSAVLHCEALWVFIHK